MRGQRGGSRRLRIIAGKWRGRTLTFADHPAIRPTPDRVRETLFNWLQPTISGLRCLDLFAGSGALGLEALSRGAARVDFVEQDRVSAERIREHLQLLEADEGQVYRQEALSFLAQADCSDYDLIFLDPPFSQGLLERTLQGLEEKRCNPTAQLYLEMEQGLEGKILPAGWQVTRSGKAGQVRSQLVQPRILS